jgi:hypothetical protein
MVHAEEKLLPGRNLRRGGGRDKYKKWARGRDKEGTRRYYITDYKGHERRNGTRDQA